MAVRERSARPKGRGAKPRKTSATIRTGNGYKLTAECRRGVDDAGLLAALREAAAMVEARAEGRGEAA